MPELLAPAGGPEQLRAAVENGADAVYLGLQGFNARAGATNFTGDELQAGIAYAHGRGVNVYLTMNTLVADHEMAAAVDAAGQAWLAGADALIVQDLGLAGTLREHLPQLPLHMSTQGTVASLQTILALQSLGFERFILARELLLDRVAQIAQASPTPVEVFVHGALCICYSGQCQMSSMIGGRSGNRGRCAQPCRLPQALRNGHAASLAAGANLLSPRDLRALDLLPALIAAGVGSLKIEGRLKSPEYVATVTSIYRNALDTIAQGLPLCITAECNAALTQVFNRGFTQGWLGGHRGSTLVDGGPPGHRGIAVGRVLARRGALLDVELTLPLQRGDSLETRSASAADTSATGFLLTYLLQNGINGESAQPGRATIGDCAGVVSPGDPLLRMASWTLSQRARRSFEGIHRRVLIQGRFSATVGEPLCLTVWDDDGHSASAQSEEPAQAARTQPLTAEAVREQLDKTGPWPFRLEDCQITLDSDAAAPKSALNALRREALDRLLSLREQRDRPPQIQPWSAPPQQKVPPAEPQLSVVLTRWRPELAQGLKAAPRVFVPLDDWLADNMPANVYPRIPFYTDLAADRADALQALERRQPALALCGSAGHGFALRPLGIAAWADQSLNAFNGYTLAALKDLGFAGITLSPEMTMAQIQALGALPLPLETAVYGRLPLMTTRHCPLGQNRPGCNACASATAPTLTDRKGAAFPLSFDPRACVCTVLNADILAVPQLAAPLGCAGVAWLRLYLHDETPDQVAQLLSRFSAAARGEAMEQSRGAPMCVPELSGKGYTKGHYFRGV